MKKILLAAFVLGSICISACKKDSPAPVVTTELATKILGKWKMENQTKETPGQMPQTTTFTNDYREFLAGGKMISYIYNANDGTTSEINGIYIVKDENTVVIGDIDRTISTIDAHNLVFYSIAENGVKFTFTLTK